MSVYFGRSQEWLRAELQSTRAYKLAVEQRIHDNRQGLRSHSVRSPPNGISLYSCEQCGIFVALANQDCHQVLHALISDLERQTQLLTNQMVMITNEMD